MTKIITEIPKLTPRPTDAHKGQFGKVLIVGGSRGMIGAPGLAANAAFRSGAGLVRVAIPRGIQLTVAQMTPCATSIPIPEDDKGMICRDALNIILEALEDNDSLALGPGLEQSNDIQHIVRQLVTKCNKPTVIDADGLNNLAALTGDVLQLSENTVLTPHPGEMKRLWKTYFREDLPPERQKQAELLAQRSGAVVVLKGADTVVTDGQNTYINQTGNPGMATGGAGDVLTGCIGALLAIKHKPLSALNAAILAVYVHGRAGDFAAAVQTETALMATDLVDFLPEAWSSLALEESNEE